MPNSDSYNTENGGAYTNVSHFLIRYNPDSFILTKLIEKLEASLNR